jgi:glucokinase
VLVTLGTGIGTAALIDGTPLRGRTGHAGILGGHLTVELDGPTCPCGNVGCGEALASTWALARDTDETDDTSMATLFATDAHPALRTRYLHVWGAVVTSLVHAYDPSVVVLSGGILRGGGAVHRPIEEYVRAHLWPSLTPPRFVVPPEPELSVARGLSVLARAATPPTPASPAPTGPAETRGHPDSAPSVAREHPGLPTTPSASATTGDPYTAPPQEDQ